MIGRKFTPYAAKIALRRSCDKFEHNLARLDSLWLDAPKTEILDQLRELWPVYRELLLDQPPVILHASKVFELSEEVLDTADQLTHAADVRAATIDGHRVNIAGRNRMLSARLTKLFLFHDWPVCDEEALVLMVLSRREFEMNFAELGASCADVPEAIAQLKVVGEHWQHFTTAFDMIPARNSKKASAEAVIAAGEALLRHVDATVKMYERMTE